MSKRNRPKRHRSASTPTHINARNISMQLLPLKGFAVEDIIISYNRQPVNAMPEFVSIPDHSPKDKYLEVT